MASLILDEKYLKHIMYLIASMHNSEGQTEEQKDKVKTSVELVLQQGKALLDKGKQPFDVKLDTDNIPNWEYFSR